MGQRRTRSNGGDALACRWCGGGANALGRCGPLHATGHERLGSRERALRVVGQPDGGGGEDRFGPRTLQVARGACAELHDEGTF